MAKKQEKAIITIRRKAVLIVNGKRIESRRLNRDFTIKKARDKLKTDNTLFEATKRDTLANLYEYTRYSETFKELPKKAVVPSFKRDAPRFQYQIELFLPGKAVIVARSNLKAAGSSVDDARNEALHRAYGRYMKLEQLDYDDTDAAIELFKGNIRESIVYYRPK